jgi:iron complex transport system substrate-binding protein
MLYLLKEDWRIVGISGYTVRPPEARKKPKVSAFINAKFDKIMDLNPDLVLAFSDLQADIVAELIKRGVTVLCFNQRSVEEIFQMILILGRVIGCSEKAEGLIKDFRTGLEEIKSSASRLRVRPRVFFEEWNDPLISGIRWVEELIEIAGGEPIFPNLRYSKSAKDRIINPSDVIELNPDVIIGSWCGRAVNKETIRNRPGWSNINAVRNSNIFEIKSTYILQPGPAALTDGVSQLHEIILKVGMERTHS